MAELSRFFDSTPDDDREYTADEFAEYFRRLLSNGIFNGGTNLKVEADGNNIETYINQGFGWIEGYLYKIQDEPFYLQHDLPHNELDRIDRIVLRLNTSLEVRSINAVVLKGTPSTSPQAPALTRENNIYELSLAQVKIEAGKSYIEGYQVTDERLNNDVCGLVNSLIQADTTEIFNQFQQWYEAKTASHEGQWEDWYNEHILQFEQQWNTWFADATTEYDNSWNNWFSNTETDWNAWFQGTKDDWNAWFEDQRGQAYVTGKVLEERIRPIEDELKEASTIINGGLKLSDGIFEGGLEPSFATANYMGLSSGNAIIGGLPYYYEENNISHDVSGVRDGKMYRYVVQLDLITGNIEVVKKEEHGKIPPLIRNTELYELSISTVEPDPDQLIAYKLTDTRQDETVCGFVKPLNKNLSGPEEV
ncbi:hypothetical protein JUJ52_11005 [Virgibacillus sp. AGTR]|uniref:hypothetical protein n=1 Tax=Virgibacillus sp. AGTR TaxID=2812055 RepID=UPI0019641139|nr:hypothetical protein [Virgibacillus sp. AGTR]MCC2250489.1 hypothetical protein [Virgibacillus sp. AGTR]QRZ18285.1 hypothetical protein JUJ52_00520 [Virgibacillus sp. AGTR]